MLLVHYSKTGLQQLTARFEGCRLVAYQDSAGVWTVGYGHTHGVSEGLVITQPIAESWLLQDTAESVDCVNKCVRVSLSQPMFDALTDFAFNVGCGALNGSTLLKLLNAGDRESAAAEFEKWDHAGGKVVAGLLRRREAEEQEFQA
jgi:lysozyme